MSNAGTVTDRRPSVYALMDDDVLARAIADLERIVSGFAFRAVDAAVRAGYEDELDRARAEAERRQT